MSGRVAPVALSIVPVVQDSPDLFFVQERVGRLFPLEPGVVQPPPAFLYRTRSFGAGVSEAIMPDLTRRIVGKALGNIGVKLTLLSEVSPLHNQGQGGLGHDLFFTLVRAMSLNWSVKLVTPWVEVHPWGPEVKGRTYPPPCAGPILAPGPSERQLGLGVGKRGGENPSVPSPGLSGVWPTKLEERDLVAFHGQAYKDYQKSVRMIIPLPKKGPAPESTAPAPAASEPPAPEPPPGDIAEQSGGGEAADSADSGDPEPSSRDA